MATPTTTKTMAGPEAPVTTSNQLITQYTTTITVSGTPHRQSVDVFLSDGSTTTVWYGASAITSPSSTSPSSTSPTPPATTGEGGSDEASGTGLSTGAIAGIAIGAVMAVLLLGLGAFLIARHRRRQQHRSQQEGQEATAGVDRKGGLGAAMKYSFTSKAELPGNPGTVYGQTRYPDKPELEAASRQKAVSVVELEGHGAPQTTQVGKLGQQVGSEVSHQELGTDTRQQEGWEAATAAKFKLSSEDGNSQPEQHRGLYNDWATFDPQGNTAREERDVTGETLSLPSENISEDATTLARPMTTAKTSRHPSNETEGRGSPQKNLQQLREERERVIQEAARLRRLQALTEEQRRIEEEIARLDDEVAFQERGR